MYRARIAQLLIATVALGLPLACSKGADKEPAPAPGKTEPVRAQASEPAAEAPAPEPPAANVSEQPEGPTGSIKGRVTITGEVPQMPMLSRGSDPACDTGERRAETIMASAEGGLANVLVRIKPNTVPGWRPKDVLVIDQDDCMYRPRVQGGVKGQVVEVRNSDKTTHNVHARELELGSREDSETLMNRAQPTGVKMRFTLGDEPIAKLKCDYHAWMSGYVLVSDNPYSAVSDANGEFSLEGVPVGTHSLEIWHEFYGLKTAELSVEEGGTASLEASFDAQADNPRKKGS